MEINWASQYHKQLGEDYCPNPGLHYGHFASHWLYKASLKSWYNQLKEEDSNLGGSFAGDKLLITAPKAFRFSAAGRGGEAGGKVVWPGLLPFFGDSHCCNCSVEHCIILCWRIKSAQRFTSFHPYCLCHAVCSSNLTNNHTHFLHFAEGETKVEKESNLPKATKESSIWAKFRVPKFYYNLQRVSGVLE